MIPSDPVIPSSDDPHDQGQRRLDLERLDGAAVVVAPGDTLLLITRHPARVSNLDTRAAALERELPGVRVLVVDQVDAAVVYSPPAVAAGDLVDRLEDLERAAATAGILPTDPPRGVR